MANNPAQLVNVNLTTRTSDWTPPTISFGESLKLSFAFALTSSGTAADPGMNITSMRATVGQQDARPLGGSTCLVLGGGSQSDENTTAALQFNASPAQIAAAINALGTITGAYGTAKVTLANGSWLVKFGDGSQEVPIVAYENFLWPVSCARVSAYEIGNEWIHEIRFTQTPVAFTSNLDVVLPPAPTVTLLQTGGSDGTSVWDTVQQLYVPPTFLGSYVLTQGFLQSGQLSRADDTTTIAAALAGLGIAGAVYTVTNPLTNYADIDFGGALAGAPQTLLGVTVITAPAGNPTLTITFDRAELQALLRSQTQVTLPFELWVTSTDGDGNANPFCAFTVNINVRRPVWFDDLEDLPSIDWLNPVSPQTYVPFGLDNILTGQLYYTTPVGDGESTIISVTHGLDSDAIIVKVRQNVDPGLQLIEGKSGDANADYSVTINNANEVTITALGAAPADNAWLVIVIGAQSTAAWAEGLTLTIAQVTGLQAALNAIQASLQTILNDLPTAPPSLTAAGSSGTLNIAIPNVAGYVPLNTLDSAGNPKLRALLPSQETAVGAIAAGTFPLGTAGAAGTVVQNQTGSTQVVPAGFGIDQSIVPANGYVASDGRLWYVVNQAGATNSFFPAVFERVLFGFEINSAMMVAGSTLQVQFAVALQLLRANTRAQYILVIEQGTVPGDTSPATTSLNLQNIVWNTAAPLLAQQLILSEVQITHNFGYAVSLDSTGTVFTGQTNSYGIWTGGAPAPATSNFAIRARLINFDTEDRVTRPKGIVSYALSAAAASITQG